MNLENVTLDTIGKGGAQEKFEIELAKVLENIRDPNTEWKGKRKITLTVEFVPKENRAEADLITNVVGTLAPMKPVISTIFFGLQEGQLKAAEIRQDELFPAHTAATEKRIYTINKQEEE